MKCANDQIILANSRTNLHCFSSIFSRLLPGREWGENDIKMGVGEVCEKHYHK